MKSLEEMREWLECMRAKNQKLGNDKQVQIIDAILTALSPLTEEWKKEILGWIHEKEPTLHFIVENNNSQDMRYHASRDLCFFSKIRALILGNPAPGEEEK